MGQKYCDEFYTLSIDQIQAVFDSQIDQGLSESQVAFQLDRFGPNSLSLDSGPSIYKIVMSNIFNSMNAILITALIISIAILDWIKMAVLLLVIVTNSGIGIAQEFKSEKTMEALKKMSSPTAQVLRNKVWSEIPAEQCVPGDIVSIVTGDVCPADLRLLEVVQLETDEAFLTGESLPVQKTVNPIVGQVSVGDQINCAFMNSTIVKGRGIGIVVRTGFETEVGKIAKMVSDSDKSKQKTPLMKALDRLMFACAFAALVFGVIVFASDRFIWSTDTFLYAISVGIAILPEGLPAVITVAMALGMRKMSKQKALVRQLTALEALGQVTNICSDKTGTLTEGKMVAKEMWVGNVSYVISGSSTEPKGSLHLTLQPERAFEKDEIKQNSTLDLALKIAALCSTASVTFDESDQSWKSNGAPTEIALQILALKTDYQKHKLLESLSFVYEFPFDSAVKTMSAVYQSISSQKYQIFTKGALERVLPSCSHYSANGVSHPISESFVVEAVSVMESFAERGMRVLGLAYKEMDSFQIEKTPRSAVESQLVFLGLVAIYDPPRPESLFAVQECRNAGIVVHMATGDHPKTAEAIAKEVGILGTEGNHGYPFIMTAAQFDALTDQQIDELDHLPRVLARCSPQSKVRLIEALHRRSKFVAMTGDGVNDAPAVKKADIGIAMGVSGSEVTKQSSSITLTDDNFKTIVNAVREGRRLFINVKNIALHLLSGNVSEVIVLVIGLIIRDVHGNPVYPMSAIQILWLNMITSSPVALALGTEDAPRDVMYRKPRKLDDGLFDTELILDLSIYGIILGAMSLGSFALYLPSLHDLPAGCGKKYLPGVCDEVYAARALSFYVLSALLLVHGFVCRHNRYGLLQNPKQNKFVWYAAIAGSIFTFPSAYIPTINVGMFEEAPFRPEWWGIVIAQVILFLILAELYKYAKRRYFRSEKSLQDPNQSIQVVVVEKSTEPLLGNVSKA